MLPYGRQNINQDDIDAVIDVLQSEFLTQGPMVPLFEEKITSYTKAHYAVAVNSATSALHIACLALGFNEGDWLWTSPITFVATANAGVYCGAKIDFIDIDPKTYNLSPHALEEKLIIAKKENRLPKIIIPVHLCGQSCDMESIFNLSQKYGFKIIEDASHAIGGKYKNKPVGNCTYSDVTIFSFHPVKIITTAEGGMAVTNNKSTSQKMRLLRSHGVTRDSELMLNNSEEAWYYQQVVLGYNYRMTDIQAALGCSQINRLDEFISKRHELKKRYDKSLNQVVKIPYQHPDTY